MLEQLSKAFNSCDMPEVNGTRLVEYLNSLGACEVQVLDVCGLNRTYKTLKVTISGTHGAISGGNSPTLGIIGQCGGQSLSQKTKEHIPDYIGTNVVLFAAARILKMIKSGNTLRGDVILSVQISSDSPASVTSKCKEPCKKALTHSEVSLLMDAVISIGSYRGGKIGNSKGIAISPTVKEGYILKTSDDLWNLAKRKMGVSPMGLPLSQQDIIPFEKGLPQAHTILQPSTATSAPVIGIAIQNEMISGKRIDTSLLEKIEISEHIIESMGHFLVDVATAFTNNECSFFDEQEYTLLRTSYGDMSHFQHIGWGHHFTGIGNAPHLLWRNFERPNEVNE